jgi:hypothetical protein
MALFDTLYLKLMYNNKDMTVTKEHTRLISGYWLDCSLMDL